MFECRDWSGLLYLLRGSTIAGWVLLASQDGTPAVLCTISKSHFKNFNSQCIFFRWTSIDTLRHLCPEWKLVSYVINHITTEAHDLWVHVTLHMLQLPMQWLAAGLNYNMTLNHQTNIYDLICLPRPTGITQSHVSTDGMQPLTGHRKAMTQVLLNGHCL